MKKIAVKLTDIAKDFIKNIQIVNPSVAGDISEVDVNQRKNGNIVFNNEIYKQTSVRSYWNEFAKNLFTLINRYVSRKGNNLIVENFFQNENGKVMKGIAKKIVEAQKENKEQFFNKHNIIIGDKYVFQLTDEPYSDELEKEDAEDTLQQQKDEKNKLTEKQQKQFDRLKKSLETTKNKINNALDRIVKNWDDEKWNLLKEKINQLIQNLQTKKDKLSETYTNTNPAEKLIEDTILEIEQQIEDIENDINVNLDVWGQDQEENTQKTQKENTTKQKEREYGVSEPNAREIKEEQVNNQSKEKGGVKNDGNGVKNDSETKEQEQLTASGFLTDDFKKSKQKTSYCEPFVQNKQIVISKAQFNKLDNYISSLVNIVRKNKWKIKVA